MYQNVQLREKTISNGKISLYLDYYPPILNTETGQFTRRGFLKRYLFAKPSNQFQKHSNIENLHTAE
ncbi:hypothetical protein [Flavobacterium sp. CFS9]|uniref:hypothetical protein n=1 Tax=Flavobacterium sp. CFS9 TaxID=3143118 RepID=UPI0034E8DF48